jgi:hypothetical protein
MWLRLLTSLVSVCVLSVVIDFSSLEFAQLVLIVFACLMFAWTFYGKYLREAMICMSMLIALLVIPFDISVTSPLYSTEGRQTSMKLLQARYGLVSRPDANYYDMGCIVPPNPIKWVLVIDVWPAVDYAFHSFEALSNQVSN